MPLGVGEAHHWPLRSHRPFTHLVVLFFPVVSLPSMPLSMAHITLYCQCVLHRLGGLEDLSLSHLGILRAHAIPGTADTQLVFIAEVIIYYYPKILPQLNITFFRPWPCQLV